MELKFKKHKWLWVPSTGILETTAPTEYPTTGGLMKVHRGTLIVQAAIKILLGFTDGAPLVSLGINGGDLEGLVAEADVTIETAGIYNGKGAELTSIHAASTANGRLYTAEGNLRINYTGDALTTVGRLEVIITYCEIE